MNRMIIALLVPVLMIILTAIALSGPPEPMETVFAPEQCERVAVLDRRLRPIEGIEDIIALNDGRLFFSAHNRRFAELPVRGIYYSSLENLDLAQAEGEDLRVMAVPGISRAVQSVYPHGMAMDRSGERLAFVNRPFEEPVEIVWGTINGINFVPAGRWAAPEACRANDVEWRGAELLATRDRASCEFSVSDVMPGAATGSLVSVGPTRAAELETGLAFANGVSLIGGRVLVAETRQDRLRVLGTEEMIELPGGPDNLSRGPFGTVIAALHTDLFDYWMYSLGYVDTAASRVVAINPETGRIDVLYDDPLGKQYSGASVGVFVQGRLILGSAFDSGILVCRR
ncbi:MAG: hypothetical protein AAFS07_01135 [Pseudomonadota bacterium]